MRQAVPDAAQLRLPGQGPAIGAPQLPLPSQNRAEVSVLPEQLGGSHRTSVPGYAQAAVLVPLTSAHAAAHMPGPAPGQAPWPVAGAPTTAEQVPGFGLTSHAAQTPSQATLQQYPSAQVCETQSSLVLHLCPFGRRPHEPLVQVSPEAQSLLVWQDSVQPVPSALQR
jgi:hypothetical protein